MNYALCFLAYGDEHIVEFNTISKQILLSNPKVHIFVLTDDKSKIDNSSITIIETQEEFNFNLKRYIIEEALKEYDTIVLLDTDIKILNNSFSFLSEITDDGIYVKWIDNRLTHNGVRLDVNNNSYLIELTKFNKTKLPIRFIPEYCVILRLSDLDTKTKFIENWNHIYTNTIDIQPKDRHYGLHGAIEGCIMYVSCLNSNIPIIHSNNKLFDSITHYASTDFKNTLI
jgi:hypothetical protein